MEARELSEEEKGFWMDLIFESARWGIEEREAGEGERVAMRGGKRKAWGGKRGTLKKASKRGDRGGKGRILGHTVGLCCSPTTSEEREEREESWGSREMREGEGKVDSQQSCGTGDGGSRDTWQERWSDTQGSSQAWQAGERERMRESGREGEGMWQPSRTQGESQASAWSELPVDAPLPVNTPGGSSQSQSQSQSQGRECSPGWRRGSAGVRIGGQGARGGGERGGGVRGGGERAGWEALRRRGAFCRGLYAPPDMNPGITCIFRELNHIYKHGTLR